MGILEWKSFPYECETLQTCIVANEYFIVLKSSKHDSGFLLIAEAINSETILRVQRHFLSSLFCVCVSFCAIVQNN